MASSSLTKVASIVDTSGAEKNRTVSSAYMYWVHTVYHNISSYIVNDGHASEFIPLKKGVRQGCPLSGMLFILAVQPLAIQIRTSKSIKGLKNGNKESKVSLYADDTTTFIHDDSSAVALPLRFA